MKNCSKNFIFLCSRFTELNHLKHKVFCSLFCDLMNPENLFVYSYEKTFSFLINFLSAQLLLSKIWFNNMNISRSWREIKKKNKISRWMFLAFYWNQNTQRKMLSFFFSKLTCDKNLRGMENGVFCQNKNAPHLPIVCLTSMKTTQSKTGEKTIKQTKWYDKC